MSLTALRAGTREAGRCAVGLPSLAASAVPARGTGWSPHLPLPRRGLCCTLFEGPVSPSWASKNLVQPCCSFLVTQAENQSSCLRQCSELVGKFRPDPHLETTAPACTSTVLKASPGPGTVTSTEQMLLSDMLEVVPGARVAALGPALCGAAAPSHPSPCRVPQFPSKPCSGPSSPHRIARHQSSAPACPTPASATEPGVRETPCHA